MLDVAVDDQFFQPAPVKKPDPPVQKEAPKPKWQPIYDGAKSLYVFRKANESILQEGVYQQILELMSEKYCQSLSSIDDDPTWEASASMLHVSGKWSHWVGHDDTLTETVDIKFERLTHWDEPAAWDAEHDLPCEKMSLILDNPISQGDNWSYFLQTHKVWLIQAPFGLPGVWRLEYKSTDSR